MGPNVKILMGQSFGSWTHGHGPMALGAWAAAARPPGRPAGRPAALQPARPKIYFLGERRPKDSGEENNALLNFPALLRRCLGASWALLEAF